MRRFAFCVRLSLRFCRGGLPWFTPAVCLSTNRTACGALRSCSAGSRSPFVRSRGVGAVICLCGFTSGLAVYLWRSRRSYRGRGENGRRGLRGNGAGGAAFVHLYAATLALQCFPRGERWGCAPQTAPKSLRLSGLSSRCGGVVLVRIRAAVARVHGKTRPALIYGRAGRAVLRRYLHAQSSRLEPPGGSGAESGCVREAERKPHSGLSGLSSRCGGVMLVRIRRPSPGYTERPDRL